MRNSQYTLLKKRNHLSALLLLVVIFAASVTFCMAGNDDFDIARREVLLRRIGHELLLKSGDSTSRVLPVKKIGGDEYQISFENPFVLTTDSLVNITRSLLARDPLTGDYVVKVLREDQADIAYSFAVSKSNKDDIVACTGRTQPKAKYTIVVQFKPNPIAVGVNKMLMGGLPILAFVGFMFFRRVKPRDTLPQTQSADVVALGSMWFDAKGQTLALHGKVTELTGTETRLLRIFAQSPNEVIERSRLQKEIWEDEGVIVGRSLDMFISKLRKKLEADPTVKIAVVRGKGYRLEVA